ncbi:tRNA uridine-5-carboxymethylaminomethyl(34) synthesis GTPase MnmE [Paracoccus beibuensis]|uniref:tRNA uridine-5-carboxymethylaminomethyl(34) synthesis GTPase MnmE n=1 Tax=Paracoccus beibuensis TaxID=547602 RepID=UPI00223F4752|nr:tRNA uridine-5-carboxymethylaminomethyl(34) synthesis GTPase MnmE [Paracoccus beibuensis]
MDLIYAEATPPGRGGVSVIRLSGDGARQAAEAYVGPLPVARMAYLRDLVDAGEIIDQVLALRFDAGASFTGEEVVELHLHGAPVVVRRVEDALLRAGARHADAGEFTKRAFLNGRMDLSEIEGLGDLLAAETESQRKLAIRAAGGELAKKAALWRSLLIEAGALVAVSVDFADEDVPDEVPSRAFELIDEVRLLLQQEVDGFSAAEQIRKGFEVAIVGPPNAGKSSLLNRLAKRDVAIVSDRAGTTRDVLELRTDLKGLAVTFLDTAGLREATDDDVEVIGIQRARDRAAAADLRIHLSDSGQTDLGVWYDGDLVVQGRADLNVIHHKIAISAVTGTGVQRLLDQVFEILSQRAAGAGLVSHMRQRLEIEQAISDLNIGDDNSAEVVAEALRQTGVALDRLIGRIEVEDYLDKIFSSFCIGK